ncbi:leucine-rich repeat transmembrane neuronal protein 3 [Alosa sapidissima]|uniref:leucine-rich repeat transmembrane neuronal protein 3 n=1 Tax=Alosa sapidissima TaxID=34773 RepID=UPI001C0900DD|nr:leucine-rich repeat transmembrane neuronal protein 3 [Alosa sapidissima]
MEITFKVLKFMLLSGPWWMSDQIALASPFPLCEWNFPQRPGENTTNHRLRVNCSGLRLGSVPSGLPSQMKALDLSYNNITEIKWFDFTHDLCRVTQLILSHNSLGKIDGGALSSLLGLKELNLSSNTLAVVTEEMFQGLRDLKVLDLRHNQLHWIHKMAFNDLANLKVLWLQNNNLRTVPDAVNLLSGLNTLSLGTNQLSQLLTGDLNRCTDLKTLQLEDNEISILAAGTFQNHENLRTVDLSSNRLEELHDTMVTFFWERGVNLHLHGNPLRCGCGSGQAGEGPAWLTDTVLCQGIGTLRREKAPLRVHKTVTLTGAPGQSLMIPCRDKYHGGMIKYWKTPVGWLTSRNSCHSYSDMKCHCNGSLTIAPRSFRSKREQPEDSTPPKGCDNVVDSNSAIPVSVDQETPETDLQQEPPETDLQQGDPETGSNSVIPANADQEPTETDLQPEPPETDLQQEPPETDLQQGDPETGSNSVIPANADQEPTETDLQPKAPVAPRPTARRSRVIKLYNYNEDGEHYSHIRDPEGEDIDRVPQPKQRTRSLIRLNAIMSSVETPALSTNTGPQVQSDQESELAHSSEEEGSISDRQHIQ